MRFFILLFSIVILLQPASWAMSMPMSHAHQNISEGTRTGIVIAQALKLTASDVGGQCQELEINRISRWILFTCAEFVIIVIRGHIGP